MKLDVPKFMAMIAVVLTMVAPVLGFWRLPCRGVLGVARMDPIFEPGRPSPHAHSIVGGGNFALNTSSEDLLGSSCTSCEVAQDKSAYWTPSLYFIHESGKAELVDQTGGMLIYYLPRGPNVLAFPRALRMVAGDNYQRNFTISDGDRPKSSWTKEDKSQLALGQRALGFNCLNYKAQPEPSLFRHALPDRRMLDEKCLDGLRTEIVFPSCWNGKDLDSPDHKSHVAYPDLVDNGVCPEGFDKRIVMLMYETIWNTNAFKGLPGEFVFSNGDPTGYGYHGDFIEGWQETVLQNAIDQCTNLSGRVEDCPLFKLQSEDDQRKCKLVKPAALGGELYSLTNGGLPGNVPIMRGPGYAMPEGTPSEGTPSAPEKVSSSSPPTISSPKVKLPLPSMPVPSIPEAPVSSKPEAPVLSKPEVPALSKPETTAMFSSETTVPQPIVTPPPETKSKEADSKSNGAEVPYATSYSTDGPVVYEIVYVRKIVTETVTATATQLAKRHEKHNAVIGRFFRHRHGRSFNKA
ncbi:hypothetical protein LOZ61_000089 [Ophidiomyces ophidiicola]|nr:hypothetical protein LOZ61_000089 [Ophidiomyces ophidiicola]KAI1931561.1 hypothetical protein LOZ60_000093 [Ophidiomyces ophidiicola]KAI1969105.1 hypothetical protein LOZ59_000131 [Ophidiomyces ophidiicola]KAI2025974.1 hypothetical protein LOZ48_005273 [Ophidiomyces ophidiicola]KAI2150362.1 hypothetical protein LOZ27_000267 [Ophidiomyces ophidiicola]